MCMYINLEYLFGLLPFLYSPYYEADIQMVFAGISILVVCTEVIIDGRQINWL